MKEGWLTGNQPMHGVAVDTQQLQAQMYLCATLYHSCTMALQLSTQIREVGKIVCGHGVVCGFTVLLVHGPAENQEERTYYHHVCISLVQDHP